MSTTRTWTDAELMNLPEDGFKRELVDGEIVMSPAGAPHGRVIIELAALLAPHIRRAALGYLFDSSTGCRMPSGNLRVPDLCFVSHARLPGGVPAGFLRVVPDLVVEVLSPGDSERRILDKVGEYLAAGVRLAWVINPATRSAACHRSLTDVRSVDADAQNDADRMLDGGDVVPGFRCRLADVLT